jgi:hypothetical protein
LNSVDALRFFAAHLIFAIAAVTWEDFETGSAPSAPRILRRRRWSWHISVAEVNQREILCVKAPFRHDLDEATVAYEFGLHHGRQIANTEAGQKRGHEAGIIHRQMRLDCHRFLVPAVDVDDGPAALGPPVGKCNQPVVDQVLRRPWRLAVLQISRARDKLMPVGENSLRDERGVSQGSQPQRDVDPVADVIDVTFGNQDFHANVGIAGLERGDQRAQQRVGNVGWRGQAQRS